MQEETEQTDGGVHFTASVKAARTSAVSGRHYPRRNGFSRRTEADSGELPVLASLGIAEIDVIRKVRVAVFSTGDELQLPGQPLKRADLRHQPPGGTSDAGAVGL
jgi:molybdopterin molybdotransferase